MATSKLSKDRRSVVALTFLVTALVAASFVPPLQHHRAWLLLPALALLIVALAIEVRNQLRRAS